MNDFVLKGSFHNWLTGKLSDLAGLFVFPIFWVAFFPRFRKAIYALTGLFFIAWKSAYSQLLIDAWNRLSLLPVSRVADPTDLLALSVLPISYFYSDCERQRTSTRLATYVIAMMALFTFTATSYRTKLDYDNNFYFPDSKTQLTRKVYHLGHLDPKYHVSCSSSASDHNIIEARIPADFCFKQVEATFKISEDQEKSLVGLQRMEHECPEGRNDKQKLLDIFEGQIITKLKGVNFGSAMAGTSMLAQPLAGSPMHGVGYVYFVAIGGLPQTNIGNLADYFQKKYRIPIKVLPTVSLIQNSPGRPLAGGLVELMKGENPKIASNPKAIMIGITEDMNVAESNRIHDLSYRSDDERFAVIATDSVNPTTFCETKNQDLLDSRLRKVIAKNIGMLYYRLPPSKNPKSVMYGALDCVDELDEMGEEF